MIFDLDETLIHCSQEKQYNADHLVRLEVGEGKQRECSIFIRPYARQILRELSEQCEVIIFTASSRIYADRIIELLDPKMDMVHHVLYRDSCVKTEDVSGHGHSSPHRTST